MKPIYRILTCAAAAACMLNLAGCGNKSAGDPAPSSQAAETTTAAKKLLEMEFKPTGNTVTVDGLAAASVWPGDVLTGNITVTDGVVVEAPSYCKIEGQSYKPDTQMKYFTFYDTASRCFLFGTNVQSEQEALQSLADQWQEYLKNSADGTATDADIPKSPVAVTGIAVSMTDDIRSEFSSWYGDDFDKGCASVNLFLTYQE